MQVPPALLPSTDEEAAAQKPLSGILYVDTHSDALLNLEPCEPDFMQSTAAHLWEVGALTLLLREEVRAKEREMNVVRRLWQTGLLARASMEEQRLR